MTESWWTDAEEDPTHEAAAEWFAKLQRADISGEDLLDFQRWLAADPRNAEAFGRLEDVAGMLRDVPRPMSHVSSIRSGSSYDGLQSISEWQRRKASLRRFAVAASVACAAVAAVTWGVWTLRGAGQAGDIVQTQVGENRSVDLPDGSRITLGGGSSLTTSFSSTGRDIQLTRGEALFVVAKDKLRPFRVQAGNTTVTAIGTQFNVRRREARVDVAVVEGEVLVEPSAPTPSAERIERADSNVSAPNNPRLAEVRITAGEKAVVGDAGIQSTSHFGATDAPIAWQSGRLVFESERLGDVIEDVNRYSRKQLLISDSSIGELMFTGTVVNGNVDAWVASIEEVFSLDAVEEGDRIVLRYRAR